MKHLALFVWLASLASGAFAHSRVDTTTPENGAVIADVPADISFNFANDIRLTRVKMTHADHPSVQLDLGDQKSFDRTFTLPLEGMGAGIYRIEWRGLGIDGHAMQSEFSFTVE
ncbi:copper resistance CopC family protein [Sulfitobacter sp. M368]|uniref:copper resistance CopC family protein n=1 Tax=Sulfitobacter sp. M368 TaxID=2867021 RepID=UPI0021A3F68C|nr:copper resistance CopC family protein [Sulfitobacter sp. M368]UWR14300.1 copper resistance protein CopC [Sulfitobacter sp. M368]